MSLVHHYETNCSPSMHRITISPTLSGVVISLALKKWMLICWAEVVVQIVMLLMCWLLLMLVYVYYLLACMYLLLQLISNSLTYATHNLRKTTTHNNMQTVRSSIQPYLHLIHAWTKSNNLMLNSDSWYDMHTHPNILGLTLDPKLTYNNYIDNTAAYASII